MSELFDRLRERLDPAGTMRRTHGLNLALKLQDPDRLPLLLWDIVVAEPRITRALEALSFVHFARFVPSWDGRALMVTTEFDGPLEPYIMDFVVALGDVFDILLGHVDEAVRPRLPVREHPEAFLEFVRQWNRVPYGERRDRPDDPLFPAGLDFPLYSSYPGRSVIDIVGPRTALPPPVIDRPAAAVDLGDVQGNILVGYRADRAAHLFLRLDDVAEARRWLAAELGGGATGAGPDGAIPRVTDATRWIEPPPRMVNIAFTHAGLETLLPGRVQDLARFPAAFRAGAQARAEGNGDVGDSAPTGWRFGRDAQSIHVVLSMHQKRRAQAAEADETPEAFDQRFTDALDGLRAEASAHGLMVVGEHSARMRPDDREPFGYRDGLSEVRINGLCQPVAPDFQPAASPGEFLLGAGFTSIFGGSSLGSMPADLARNGTFGVLRLLEQDVDLFDRTLSDEALRLDLAPDVLKAQLMGRWPEGGQPLALDPETPRPTTSPNAFDYAPSWEHPEVVDDHAGERCPLGAHVRRVNPRTARVAGQRHSHRLIRRGMPSTWLDEAGQPCRGLLGLFIGASIEHQFEFIQRQWIQRDIAAVGAPPMQDPIAGLRSQPTRFRLSDGREAILPPWVRTRGCLYLFFPGLSMLRGLAPPADREDAATTTGIESFGDVETAAQWMTTEAVVIRDAALALDGIALPTRSPTWPEPALLSTLTFETLRGPQAVEAVATQLRAPWQQRPALAAAPVIAELSPTDPAFMADPYPRYAALRKQQVKVVRVPAYRAWWVLDRAEVQAMLADPGNFLQRPADRLPRGLLTMEAGRHQQVIAAVRDAFQAATRSQAAWTDEAIDHALERIDPLGRFDFVSEFGSVVPSAVYWRIFGLDDGTEEGASEVAQVDALARTMMRHYGQPARPGMNDELVFADAATRLATRLGRRLFKEWLASLVGSQSPGLIGELARRTEAPFRTGALLGFAEALLTLVQLALVHMSAQFLLGTAVRHLLLPDPRSPADPLPWDRLHQLHQTDRGGFEAALELALEEARRVDPPVTLIERFAARTLTIDGVTIERDAPVFAVVAAANRDLDAADAPEEFHWNRKPSGAHLSLGHGIHECVGRQLQARLATAALTRLIEELPELRLSDAQAVPAWVDNIYFRALQSLPVTRCA